MRWVAYVACIGAVRNEYNIFSEDLKARDHSDDLGVGVRIIF
jgi:hypothetical protein